LTLDGPPVLAHDLCPEARFQLAALDVQEDFDFPRLEPIAPNCAAREVAHQPVEPVEHAFPWNPFPLKQVVVCRRHI
jgi:hypothetical protein